MIEKWLEKFYGRNWKTGLTGTLAAAASLASISYPKALPYIAAAAFLVNGLAGKDGDVTGGKRGG